MTLRDKGEDEVRWDNVMDVFRFPRNSPHPASCEMFGFGFIYIYLSDNDIASQHVTHF